MRNATALPTMVPASAASVSSRNATNKRQQQLYSPGSGPLRKTELTSSNRSLNNQPPQTDEPSRQRWGNGGADALAAGGGSIRHGGSGTDSNVPGCPPASGGWRTEGHSNQQANSGSSMGGEELEPRGFAAPAPINRMQRDTRSVEPRYVGGSKKPSMPSLSHLENLPPRLQKKTLQDLGLPPNYLEIMRAEQQAMSQTLPNRSGSRHNRGRPRGYAGSSGGGGGGSSGAYYTNASYGASGRTMQGGNRPASDDDYSRPRSRSSEIVCGPEGSYAPRRGPSNRDRRMEPGPGSRNSSCDRKELPRGTPYANDASRRSGGGVGGRFRQYSTDSNRMLHDGLGGEVPSGSGYGSIPPYKSSSRRESYNWANDYDGSTEQNVAADHSRWHGNVDMETVPPAVPMGNNNRNRQRNRSTSRSRNDYYDEIKMSYQQRVGNRSRRNSQSSNVSRENSSERPYSRSGANRRGPYRDASTDRAYESGGRFQKHARDRYNNRSRDNSMNRPVGDIPYDTDGSGWRNTAVAPADGAAPLNDHTERAIAEMTKQFESSIGIQKGPGVLVIPSGLSPNSASSTVAAAECGGGRETKLLFDPKNPSQPIVVTRTQSRASKQRDARDSLRRDEGRDGGRHQLAGGPAWYNPDGQQAKLLRQKELIYKVVEADAQLQELMESGNLYAEWARYEQIRRGLQDLLETFLVREMRFAQDVNLEHHFWKMLFYGIIEQLRKQLSEAQDEQWKQYLQERALEVVESGTAYFEQLLTLLEREHRFSLEQFIGANAATSTKGLRYALALVSSQKIFLFLGDLARYREQITGGHNFRKAKQWYVKAQQILPKNGRPYNQLALLSVYAKRKIDAVYFYMRSLMSSNPFESARESLMDLFNETKKKFENNQRKREDKLRARRKEKEQRFDGNLRREIWIHPEGGSRVHRTGPLYPIAAGHSSDTSDEEELQTLGSIELNKRFIISFLHVLGKLITKTGMESFTQCAQQMLREFRVLVQVTPIAVTSYRLLQLMSLNMFAIEMTKLKDTSTTGQETRSELQECALSSGLLMFGILLERFIRLIQDALDASEGSAKDPDNGDYGASETPKLILPEDAKVILPAIKVWCDWMMSNTDTWNPPPCCADYKIGKSNAHDPWSELAVLMNILKRLDTNRSILSVEQNEAGYENVRLPEDITLAGFTPLMYYDPEPIFVHPECDMEEAQNVLRIQKLLYFGTDRLCHCEPPVLRREQGAPRGMAEGRAQFYSVVQNRTARLSDMDILLESYSDDEELEPGTDGVRASGGDLPKSVEQHQGSGAVGDPSTPSADSGVLSGSSSSSISNGPSSLETRKLLRRKDELERKQRMQEKHSQRLQDILSQSTIAVSIEVHPRLLVTDTNCFVDYLGAIELIAKAHPLYQLMVPIIVINELEGLSKGLRNQSPKQQTASTAAVAEILVPVQKQLALPTAPATVVSIAPANSSSTSAAGLHQQHAAKVADASKKALQFIKSRNPALKCVTTKGSILKTSTFTVEDDVGDLKSNDDRILETALNLCRNHIEETRAGTRYLTMDVVLLTTDRNLRVKAISNDLPVREIPDFIKWAGLSA
uniref:telomerase-binding protein EST1A isoform X1 n=1 Tax=Anopheles coluzzii TaxID=1518534 RepID=UPI0020FFE9A5|nr:telomerase-binding protein EST1A isoform X1 [Anopheles coluzzii]